MLVGMQTGATTVESIMEIPQKIKNGYDFLWGTVPSVGNVAQPPLRKASGEGGWRAGPTPWIGSPVGNQACIVS